MAVRDYIVVDAVQNECWTQHFLNVLAISKPLFEQYSTKPSILFLNQLAERQKRAY